MVDALKRASVERITAVIPYFGYARPDRRPRSTRVPISAKVVANMLQAVGVRVLTMDLHADQIQGFFDIPVDNIYASPVLLGDLRQKNYENLVVVSPDVGGVVRARALAKQLGCDLAIIDKRRPKANVSEVMHVIGDIEGRNCVIMDDMIDTAGTLVKAAEVLKERGANKVYAYCTHPIFSGPAIERIASGAALDEVVVTIHHPADRQRPRVQQKIRQISVAPLIAETIQRISTGESVIDPRFRRTDPGTLSRPELLLSVRAWGLFNQLARWSRQAHKEFDNMQFVALSAQGTGASRRRAFPAGPRHRYGGAAEPLMIEIDHNALVAGLKKEAFHSSIPGHGTQRPDQPSVLRDVQYHPLEPAGAACGLPARGRRPACTLRVCLHYEGLEARRP